MAKRNNIYKGDLLGRLPKHKRHSWVGSDDCSNCGAYTEFCRVRDCFAYRFKDKNGKIIDKEV